MLDALKRMFKIGSPRISPVQAASVPAAGTRDTFLAACKGVIHIGANSGQERKTYADYGLPVVWIEALPSIFEKLQVNIAPYPNQVALQALVTAKDDEMHVFRVANNEGASSSILDFKHHKDIWPDVHFVDEIAMRSQTLPTLLRSNGINFNLYDALVMDTQGSELMILQGAADVLDGVRYIKTEAADFESYENCATVETLTNFLRERGFKPSRSHKFAEHPTLGAYYDILFERSPRGKPEVTLVEQTI